MLPLSKKERFPRENLTEKIFITISPVGFHFLQSVFLSWVGPLKHNAHFCFHSALNIFFSKQNNNLN